MMPPAQGGGPGFSMPQQAQPGPIQGAGPVPQQPQAQPFDMQSQLQQRYQQIEMALNDPRLPPQYQAPLRDMQNQIANQLLSANRGAVATEGLKLRAQGQEQREDQFGRRDETQRRGQDIGALSRAQTGSQFTRTEGAIDKYGRGNISSPQNYPQTQVMGAQKMQEITAKYPDLTNFKEEKFTNKEGSWRIFKGDDNELHIEKTD